MVNQQTVIIGANSDIAKAIVKQLQNNTTIGLTLISRNLADYDHLDSNINPQFNKITVEDYQEETIQKAVSQITLLNAAPITQVFICHGLLHNDSIQPEKRLEAFNATAFQSIINANALTPMLWIQHLVPILPRNIPVKIVAFSARVGSISENTSGGWYSYRTSKAALNMLLKTVAIELSRRAKNVKIISFHPGTTDTPLSKPFHKNVPSGKLFTTEFVAIQLLQIVEKAELDGEASYLDWKGETINW